MKYAHNHLWLWWDSSPQPRHVQIGSQRLDGRVTDLATIFRAVVLLSFDNFIVPSDPKNHLDEKMEWNCDILTIFDFAFKIGCCAKKH